MLVKAGNTGAWHGGFFLVQGLGQDAMDQRQAQAEPQTNHSAAEEQQQAKAAAKKAKKQRQKAKRREARAGPSCKPPAASLTLQSEASQTADDHESLLAQTPSASHMSRAGAVEAAPDSEHCSQPVPNAEAHSNSAAPGNGQHSFSSKSAAGQRPSHVEKDVLSETATDCCCQPLNCSAGDDADAGMLPLFRCPISWVSTELATMLCTTGHADRTIQTT